MRVRRVLLVVLALAAGIVGAGLVLHSAPVRALVLRYATRRIEAQYQIRVTAARLDYNLASMRVGLAGVVVASAATPGRPFFEAGYVGATLTRAALVGDFAVAEVVVTAGHVTVVRTAQGTNLPASTRAGGGTPAALRIAHIVIPGMAVEIRDETDDLTLTIPALSIDLAATAGRVSLGPPARFALGRRETRISRFEGAATFDGRSLHLADLQVRSAEASMRVDGSVALIVADPSMDLRIKGTGDVERMSAWAVAAGERPRGTVAFDLHAAGPFARGAVDLQIDSAELRWQRLVASGVRATARLSPAALDVTSAGLVLAGGRVAAAGHLPFDDSQESRLTGSWSGVDLAVVTRALASDASLAPAGVTTGTIDVRGPLRDRRAWAADARVGIGPAANARGRLAGPGDSRLQVANGRWRLDGAHQVANVAPVRVALAGALGANVTSGPVAGTVDVDSTSATALADALGTVGLAEMPRGSLTAGRLQARVRVSGGLSAPVFDVTGAGEDLAGEWLPLSRLAVEARLVGSELTVTEASLTQPALPGRVRVSGRYDLRRNGYDAVLSAVGLVLVPAPGQPLVGRIDADFAGSGTFARPVGTGTLKLTGGAWDGTALGDLEARLALDGSVARVEASAPRFNATATSETTLTAPYMTVVDARTTNLDIAPLTAGVKTPTPLTGTATASLHGEGALERWRTGAATLDILALEARAGELPVRLDGQARIAYVGSALPASALVRVERFEARAGATRISASGALGISSPSAEGLAVTVSGDVSEAARALNAAGLARIPLVGGRAPLAVVARVTGSMEQPILAGDLDMGPGSVVVDTATATDVRGRAHLENGIVDLRELAGTFQGAVISATGSAPLSWFGGAAPPPSGSRVVGGAALHARATNVSPAVLAPFVITSALDEITGAIDLSVNLESPTFDLAGVAGDARIDRLDVRVADLPVTQRSPTRIVARDGFARIEAWDWAGQGATLGVQGQVRLADLQAGIIASGQLDLRLLGPFLRSAGVAMAGTIAPRLSVTGRLDNPRIDGDVAVSGGEIRFADPRIVVTGLTGRVVVSRSRAEIADLAGSINGGSLALSGGAEFVPDAGVNAHLTADIRRMALEFPTGLRSELDAALELALAAEKGEDPSGRLTGLVTVARSSYRQPLAVVTGLLTSLRSRAAAGPVAASPVLDRLDLDVHVVTDEDIVVDNSTARLAIGGDLRLIGTARVPALSGRADLREGGRIFIGRNVYQVTTGQIDFASSEAIEPQLNVQLATQAGGEDIEVTLTGTAESPSVTLSSSNSDLAQADLTSLLVTGRRFDALGSADAALISDTVLGNLSGDALGFAGRAIGLDSLRLGGVESDVRRDPTAVAVQTDPASRLTLSKSIGPQVDVTFSQSLRDSDALTWIVDYLPARRLLLRLVSNDDDLRAYEFRHDLTFRNASPSAPRTGGTPRREAARVKGVNVTGELAFPEARVRGGLRLDPGDRFDFAAWQDDRDRLERFYRANGRLAARVAATRGDAADGVTLSYAISAGPDTRIEVTGFALGDRVMAQLREAWAYSFLDDALVEEARGIVRGDLVADGYLQATVTASVAGSVGGSGAPSGAGEIRTLRVVVDPGTKNTDANVVLSGADGELKAQTEALIREQGLAALAARDPGAFVRALTAWLRERGYARSRATVGAPVFRGASVELPVTVVPGPRVVVGRVAFEGAGGVDAEVLQTTVGLTAEAPLDPAALDAALARLVARYRREGFPDARATVRQTPRDEGNRVVSDVTFVVTEGSGQTVAEVNVTGNRGIDIGVITRALKLPLDQPLRAEEVLQARRRVFDTGLFRRVDVTTEAVTDAKAGAVGAAGATTPMRARVVVEEWPAIRLRYGLQVAEERPDGAVTGSELVPGLSADVTRRTLFGRAVATGGAVTLQRRDQSGRLFVVAPSMFSLPLSTSVTIERSRQEFAADTLVADKTGASWEERLRVAKHLTVASAYRFERNHTFDTKPATNSGLDFDVQLNVARLTGSGAWDSRSDPANPVRGTLISSSLEWASGKIRSDIVFIRQVTQAYRYTPWRGVVFASAARLGVVRPLGGQVVIPSVRFFGGGSRSVRGVAEDALGGLDFFGDPKGGESQLILNQEARFPLYRWIRGVGFIDAGNVFARPRDTSLSDLTTSMGVGLRLTTPFAILRVDYGRVVRTGSGTGAQAGGRWTFGIGQVF